MEGRRGCDFEIPIDFERKEKSAIEISSPTGELCRRKQDRVSKDERLERLEWAEAVDEMLQSADMEER